MREEQDLEKTQKTTEEKNLNESDEELEVRSLKVQKKEKATGRF